MIPDLIASSSSAAMVARQMAAANQLDGETLWRETQDAIASNTRRDLAAAEVSGEDVRSAFLRRLVDAR